MLHSFGLATLGRDAELRDHDGTDYSRLSLAFNYGRKVDGKYPTQWVEATLWGKQASALNQYLTKGQQVSVVLEDLHIEEFESNGEKRTKLAARVAGIQLARGGERTGQAAAPRPPAPAPAPRPAPAPAPRAPTGFDDMDDDVPF